MLASQGLEHGELLLFLHPFGGDGETKHPGEIQDGLDDGLVLLAVHQRLDEASIQFDLIGGQIDFMFDSMPSAMPFIQSGQLRPLAVTTPERVAALLALICTGWPRA